MLRSSSLSCVMTVFLNNREEAVELFTGASPCVSHAGFGPLLTSPTSSANWA